MIDISAIVACTFLGLVAGIAIGMHLATIIDALTND